MKTPVRSSRGQLKYTGRIAPESFSIWADSPAGRTAVEQLAARTGFTLFGRVRGARKRMWRQLTEVARTEAVGVALQREVDAYLSRLDTFVYADSLPYATVDLRRLIVVPRLFANGEAHRRIQLALHVQPLFAGLNGGESLRRWFALTLISSLATAVVDARPSVKRPLPVGDGWIVVGVDEEFEWQIPFDTPVWPGHYFVLELTRRPITRAVRTAAAKALADLEASLPSLSYIERTEIIRRSALSLDRLFGKPKRAAMSQSA